MLGSACDSDMASRLAEALWVDAHVHLHPRHGLAPALDAAAANVAQAGGTAGALLLVESAGVDRFGELRDAAGSRSLGGWEVQRTEEPTSLVLHRKGAVPLLLVAGRQVVTDDRLEVLAVGCTVTLEDGRPLPATIDAALDAGAWPLLAWGVGKWMGRRGRRIADALARFGPAVGVVDNGGRPQRSLTPPLLRQARAAGIPALRGSDPLNLPGEEQRIASYGQMVAGPFDTARPAATLIERLQDTARAHRPYGRRVSWPRLLAHQWALRRNKRHRST